MSAQINFYADHQDTEKINSWILKQFPGLMAIREGRGQADALRAVPAAEQLTGSARKLLLVPSWATSELVYRDVELERCRDMKIIAARENPVIEYSPCYFDEARECLRIGRLYWGFEGTANQDELRQIERLMRCIRSQSVPHPKHKSSRIFPHAAHNVRWFESWSLKPEPNPLFAGGEQRNRWIEG